MRRKTDASPPAAKACRAAPVVGVVVKGEVRLWTAEEAVEAAQALVKPKNRAPLRKFLAKHGRALPED